MLALFDGGTYKKEHVRCCARSSELLLKYLLRVVLSGCRNSWVGVLCTFFLFLFFSDDAAQLEMCGCPMGVLWVSLRSCGPPKIVVLKGTHKDVRSLLVQKVWVRNVRKKM